MSTGLPLGCEAVFERGVRYSYSGLEILLSEGGDVELGARTSEHILVFAFDPLVSLTLSLLCALHYSYCHIIHMLVLCLAYFILLYLLYVWLFVCASLVLNHKSFI